MCTAAEWAADLAVRSYAASSSRREAASAVGGTSPAHQKPRHRSHRRNTTVQPRPARQQWARQPRQREAQPPTVVGLNTQIQTAPPRSKQPHGLISAFDPRRLNPTNTGR